MVQYIAQLLTEQDCVIIPEVGGLVGNYSTAISDLHAQQIRPPFKEIAFNRNLTHNDGLLANRIATAEGIGYGDALQKVRDFARQCMSSLENSGSCVFEGIGRLYYDNDRRMQFAPQLGQNYLLQSYGLPVLDLHPIQRFREAAKTNVTEEVPLEKNVINMPAERWLYALLGAVAILALITSFALNISQVEKGTDFSSIFPLPLNNKTIPITVPQPLKNLPSPSIVVIDLLNDTLISSYYIAENSVSDTEQIKEYVTQENDLRESHFPPVPLPLDAYERGAYFTIVAGAFVKKNNASRFARELREQGYEVHIMPNGRFSRVGLMFDTATTTLEAARDSIKKSVEETAWVLP